MNQLSLLPRHKRYLAPGAIHVPNWLSLEEQQALLQLCRDWAKPPAGLYTPKMPDGKPLSVRVVCLGWHWFPYRYSKIREDCDHLPCKPFPEELQTLTHRALKEMLPQYADTVPDTAIINWYGPEVKLGMHQDKTESEAVRNAGSPIVSISLGDSCLFRFSGLDRNDAYQGWRAGELDKTSWVHGGDTERFPCLWKQAESSLTFFYVPLHCLG